jgi:hypothetical protein
MLVYLVICASGQVSLEHLLLSWYHPRDRRYQTALKHFPNLVTNGPSVTSFEGEPGYHLIARALLAQITIDRLFFFTPVQVLEGP